MANIGLHLETCFGSYDLPLDSRSEELDLIEGLRDRQRTGVRGSDPSLPAARL